MKTVAEKQAIKELNERIQVLQDVHENTEPTWYIYHLDVSMRLFENISGINSKLGEILETWDRMKPCLTPEKLAAATPLVEQCLANYTEMLADLAKVKKHEELFDKMTDIVIKNCEETDWWGEKFSEISGALAKVNGKKKRKPKNPLRHRFEPTEDDDQ